MITSSIGEGIRLANQRFMAAFGRGDAAAVARCYTPDGQVLPPQSEPAKGRAAIEAFWRAVMGMGIARVSLETVEIIGDSEIACEVGRYSLSGADNQTVDRGKYVVIWRMEAGEWNLHRDIWNTSVAPSA